MHKISDENNISYADNIALEVKSLFDRSSFNSAGKRRKEEERFQI